MTVRRIPDASDRVPCRGEVAWEELPDGRVRLEKRRFGAVGQRLLRAVGMPPGLVVHLDPLGSRAWLLLDGQRTVAAVLEELRRRAPEEEDLPERLGRFLSTMVSNGMVHLEQGGRLRCSSRAGRGN